MSRWGERVELQLGGTWVDITGDVHDRDPIEITRGRSGEGSVADPSRCTLTLNNRDGKYSPRNPRSPYYGLLTRNVPLRVSLPGDETYLRLPGGRSGRAATPATSALDITGDLDVRIDATLPSWAPSDFWELAGRWNVTSAQRSWRLLLGGGRVWLSWSPDSSSLLQVGSAADLLPVRSGRMAVRVVLDVNNGSGGRTITFYWAPTIAGPWTQFDQVVESGTTSIAASTAPLYIGDISGLGYDSAIGKVHAFELRDGIGGTVVADPDFAAQTPGVASFADSAGRTWTIQGDAEITDRDYRFYGEVSRWPQHWDKSGVDHHVKVVASGIMRRITQGASPVRSTMLRALTEEAANVIAYWPLEDGERATSFAEAGGGRPMVPVSGTPDPASFSDFVGSAPVVTLKDSWLTAPVPTYTSTGSVQLRMLLAVPEGGPGGSRLIARLLTSGTAPRWDLWYDASGQDLAVTAYDGEGNSLGTTSTALGVLGMLLWVSFELTQSGANVNFAVRTYEQGAYYSSYNTGTVANRTFGTVRHIYIGSSAGVGDTAVGHIALYNTTTSIYDLRNQFNAYNKEPAGARVTRLCRENSLPAVIVGDPARTERMGAQPTLSVVELLRECETADMGILYEPRDALAIAYRTRETLYAQAPAVTLDFAAAQVSDEFVPVDDDQHVRNDVEVQRAGGSSVRLVAETGPLSVQAPPNGVGRYDESVTSNVCFDEQLPGQASWRLHLGTWDEERYPTLLEHLANPHLSPDQRKALRSLDVGDRIEIVNPPPTMPPEAISQLVAGYTETITLSVHKIRFNLVPARPYDVGQVAEDAPSAYGLADAASRYGTAGSELAAGVDEDDVELLVTTTAGGLWTADPADYPFDLAVGGETVRAVAPGHTLNSNPDFGGGISGWTAFGGATIAWSDVRSYTGSHSLLLTTGVDAMPRAESAKAPVRPGEQYRAIGWIWADGAIPSGIGITVNWYDAGGNYLSTSANRRAPLVQQWELHDNVFTAPAGAAQAGILVSIAGTPGAGIQVWADEIRLIPVPSANNQNSAASAFDTFDHPESGGWGTSNSGHVWQVSPIANAGDFAVSGGRGTIQVDAINSTRRAYLPSTFQPSDVSVVMAASIAELPANGNFEASIILRVDPDAIGDTYYYGEVEYNYQSSRTVQVRLMRRQNAVETQLAPRIDVPDGLTYTAGQIIWCRFEVIGPQLRLRAWANGQREPDVWHRVATDTALTSGRVGLRVAISSGATNTLPVEFRIHHFEVQNPQRMTVIRSQNGIVKSHTAGTAVALSTPTIRAL